MKKKTVLVPFSAVLALAAFFLWRADFAKADETSVRVDAVPVSPDPSLKKVLFFSKCSGYQDTMICQSNGEPSVAQIVLWDLGKRNHIQFTFTADGSVFTPENIAKYDAFCFFTSGDLTELGGDRNPPMTRESKAALLAAIQDGKGFVGIHSATDTFLSGPEGVDPYIQMLGGELLVRVRGLEPAHQIVADTNFPGMDSMPPNYGPPEEWYAMRNYATNLHVLLIMDTATMVRGSYYAPNYPSTWARQYGKGRVFYTNLGHEKDVWNGPVFQHILAGAFNWADGSIEADVSPNIERMTPHLRMQ